jgi:DNA mismatch repair protein MutL
MATRRIQILPDSLVNQIAAGEVVERPASVVKELVENALDAAAAQIEIEIRNGGKTEIRVADDGLGMIREDALLAIDRHATSKIRADADLGAIHTLGFRGEALPSIAAVSRFELETASDDEPVGTRVKVNAGRVVAVEEMARQRGTTVTVRSLFLNVPARAKFLKSAAAESRAVSDAVVDLALSHLGVGFRLVSNGRELVELRPAPDLATRIEGIWGPAWRASCSGPTRRARARAGRTYS